MCLFVCLFVSLSRCLSGRFNYEGLVTHKQHFQVHCWGCLVVQVMSHALMTSSMTSPGHKVDQIWKLIYPVNIWARASIKYSKSVNVIGYISVIFNFRYHFRWKRLSRAQNRGHFENLEILNTASVWPQIWKDRPKLCRNKYFSWWWHHHRWCHRVTLKSALYILFKKSYKISQIIRN